MILVLNASPLIFLNKIDCLSLLPGCFDSMLIPPVVVAEIRDLAPPAFIRTVELSAEGKAYVQGATGRLHAGELEAIMLAREQQTVHVALDDKLARAKAVQLGLQPIGTIGLLLLANRHELIGAEDAKSKLRALITHHGLYLSEHIAVQVEAALR